jgi:hypothetical protein
MAFGLTINMASVFVANVAPVPVTIAPISPDSNPTRGAEILKEMGKKRLLYSARAQVVILSVETHAVSFPNGSLTVETPPAVTTFADVRLEPAEMGS